MKSLDEDIRDTLDAAAGGAAPDGYYERLADNIAGALEVQEMQGGKMSTGANTRATTGKGAKSDELPPDMLSRSGSAADDDSGLIDIKNMARSTKRRVTQRMSTESDVEESLLASSRPSALRDVVLPEPGKESPLMALGSSVSSMPDVPAGAVEALEDTEAKKSGAWIALAAAVVLIGGGVAGWMALEGGTNSDKRSAAVAANEAPAPGADDPADNGGSEPPAVAADPTGEPGGIVAEAIDDSDGATDDSDDDTDDTDDSDDTDDADKTGASGDGAVAAVTASRGAKAEAKSDPVKTTSSKSGATKTETKKDRPAVAKKDDEPAPKDDGAAKKDGVEPDFEDLLDGATGGAHKPKGGGAVKAEPEDDAPKKTKLTRADIKAGMASVRGRVVGCYEQFKVPGTVSVKVKISNTGVVTSASATGKFAGTDTGACVAKAVTAASFPEFGGAPMSFSYPFLLQ